MTTPAGTVRHNSLQIHFSLLGASSDASTKIHYSGPSFATTQQQLQDWAAGCATAIMAATLTNLNGLNHSTTEITHVTASYSEGLEQHAAADATVVPVVGTGVTLHPGQDAVVFSLRTARTGKSYRGRLYWPFSGGQMTAGGTAAFDGPATLLELDTLLKAFSTASPAAGLVPVVWSRTRDLTTQVTAIATDFAVDTQRRRKHPPVQPIVQPY